MPTERFYNLPAGKKNIIKEAAMSEFANVPFEKASINKIIKAAGISRGSFYTYFEDKHDILAYIFEDVGEHFQDTWKECAEKSNGDLWKTIDHFMDESVFTTKEKFIQLMKNIVDGVQLFGVTNHLSKEAINEQLPILNIMYESIDKSKFKDQSIEAFGVLISMLFFEMFKGLEWYFVHPEDKDKIKKVFNKKLEIFQYGICKQELI